MAGVIDGAIEQITANRLPHFEPYGWHHWPEHPWLAYQFRRGLGETQEGGGTVSESFQAASRMIPGSLESWHVEWKRIADRNWSRGLAEEQAGHIRTAMNCFLRAADYYRQAEFHLEPTDPRRLPTFEAMEPPRPMSGTTCPSWLQTAWTPWTPPPITRQGSCASAPPSASS